MTILTTLKFLRSPFGRLLNLVLIVGVLNLSSCTTYKPTATSVDDLRSNEQVQANLDTYRFFVHDDFNHYQLTNPVLNEDGSITGSLELTAYETPDDSWSRKQKQAYWNEHLYDINVYVTNELSDLRADLSTTNGESKLSVTLTPENIASMTITSIDMEAEAGDAAMVILGLVVVAAVVVLVILLIGASEGGGGGDGSGSASGSD